MSRLVRYGASLTTGVHDRRPDQGLRSRGRADQISGEGDGVIGSLHVRRPGMRWLGGGFAVSQGYTYTSTSL